MAKLITGGSGQIGAELAHILVGRGEEVVVFDKFKTNRLNDIKNKLVFVQGDVGVAPEVMEVVKKYKITNIFHLGAMLTSESEGSPWASFQINIMGMFNVMEAARLFDVKQVFFTSSVGTFGNITADSLTDYTVQRPTSIYGVAKLYGEGLGRWFDRRFGVDFRGVRYPSVVGPGILTPGHWDTPMIHHAIMGKTYECSMPPAVNSAMLYYKDAARAADLLMQAPKESIKTVVYNIGAVPSVSPKEMEGILKKHIPGTKVNYSGTAESAARLGGKKWDDSYARSEWGWQPKFTTSEQVVGDYIMEMKTRPELYG